MVMRGRRSDESYELEGSIETSTAKAWLVEWTNGAKCWLPKSQAELIDEDNGQEMRQFRVRGWFAEKEGLA